MSVSKPSSSFALRRLSALSSRHPPDRPRIYSSAPPPAYLGSLASLCAIEDASLEVPSIVIDDLTCTEAHNSRCNNLRASASLPNGFGLRDTHTNRTTFPASCSLKVPLDTWGKDLSISEQSTTCERTAETRHHCGNLDGDSLEHPWLELDDDDLSVRSEALVTTGASVSGPSSSSLRFLGTLGRGGYGKVLLAEQIPSNGGNACVAVKVLAKKHMNKDDVQDLKTEIRILRDLVTGAPSLSLSTHSPFVQDLHDLFQTREHVFLVIERHSAPLSHPHYRRRLRLRTPTASPPIQTGPFPASFSLPIAFPSCTSISTPYEEALHALRLLSAELLLGLLFLHARGIIHQDIKPANILVSAGGHAVITDFGSSRTMPELPEMSANYHSSHANDPDFFSTDPRGGSAPVRYGPIVLGADDQVSFTRRYAAPELTGVHAPSGRLEWYHQGQDVLVYDERIDFFSLGVMLRELALGEPADGSAANDQDRWERASDGQHMEADTVTLDSDFEAFTDQLLASDPDERLHGEATKDDRFFAPISELWEDIAERHFPPFVNVVWQDADDDTRLDLRSYSGPEDSQDSLASTIESWKEEQLADIPFDSPAPKKHAMRRIRQGPVASERRAPLLLPAVNDASRQTSCTTLNTSDVLSVALKDQDSETAVVSVGQPGRLRRRRGMYDLRQAFRLGPDVPSEPSRDVKHGPGRTLQRSSVRTQAVDVKPQAVAAGEWSFEHQITIALLATMVPPDAARGRAEPGGGRRLGRREASRMRSFLRKLNMKGARV